MHDLGSGPLGDAWEEHFDLAENGCFRALRDQDATGARGLGNNVLEPPVRALRGADPDVIPIADRQPPASRLAPRLTVHSVDRRGHGRGDQPSQDIVREQEDAEAVMAAGSGTVLFGHSYGGLIATAVALRQPPAGPVQYDPGPPLHAPLGGPATADVERAVAAGDHEGAPVVGLREVLGVPTDGIERFRALPQCGTFVRRIATWPRELQAVDAARFPLADLAAGLTGPVLIVTG